MTLQRFGRLELREPDQTNSPERRTGMRTIASWLFITLDGVVEAPETWVIYNEQMGEAIDQQALSRRHPPARTQDVRGVRRIVAGTHRRRRPTCRLDEHRREGGCLRQP